MWAILAAPLIAGNDLRNMNKETLEILTNRDVISVDQDSLGIQGFKYSAKDSVEIWFKPLVKGDWAMCILNRSKENKKVTFDWKNEDVIDDIFQKEANFKTVEFRVKNLWTKKELQSTKTKLDVTVPSHDVAMYRLIK
jgi:alpha-galactosidase